MLRIEIKNIEEVARQKSAWVNAASRFAPGLVKTALEKAAAIKIRSELRKMGVEADVRVEADAQ